MNIAQSVEKKVNSMPRGKIFGYQKFPNYAQSSSAVIKSISRLVAKKKLKRLSKGKFYIPKKGLLGPKKPSEQEILRSILYKNGRLIGYVTGPLLYNQLGLTTQVPRTITIACNGGRQEKEFNTIRIKKRITRIPIEGKNIKLIQYLDVLKDIKKIPDSDINLSLKRMRRFISELSCTEQKCLVDLATDYYSAQVRALSAMLLSDLNMSVPRNLIKSLNPITTYKLNLDQSIWPKAKNWNIK